MVARSSGFYRPSAARKRLIKDQERADDYKEWMAAKTIQLEQEKQQGSQPAPCAVAEKQKNGDLEMR